MPKKKNPEKNKVKTISLELGELKHSQTILWLLGLTIILAGFLWAITQLSTKQVKPRSLSSETSLANLFKDEILKEEAVSVLKPNLSSAEKLSLVTSPDGRRFAYILKNNGQQQVIVNEQAGPLFDAVSQLSFSPDSHDFAYLARNATKELVVLNGVLSPEYDFVLTPRFYGAKNSYYSFKARQQGKDILVINNQASRPYDYIYEPFLSSDKKYLVYFALDGDNLWRGSIPILSTDD